MSFISSAGSREKIDSKDSGPEETVYYVPSELMYNQLLDVSFHSSLSLS